MGRSFLNCPTHKSPLHRVAYNILDPKWKKLGKKQGKHIATSWYYCQKGDHCIKLAVVRIK